MRIVAIDDRGAARLDALKNLRLGVGDGLDRGEEFEMHRLDRGDDRDMRAHQPGQRRDLAGVVHAHLEHRIARARRAARQRQRHAPVVVVGGGRSMGLAVARQRELERLLGAGLADRAGDADEFGGAARPRRACQRDQPLQHVGHDQQRRVVRKHAALVRGHDSQPAAGFQRRLDEIMAVADVLEREERFARRDGAGVDRQARHGGRQRALRLRAHRLRHRLDRPQRTRAHATFSRSAASTAS